MSILDWSNRFYNTGNITHLCVILPELTGLNTSVEPKTVLAIIYSTFVRYIILIAKNIHSLIRESKVWQIVEKPTTDYVSNKLCGLVHSGGNQRQRPKGGRIGGRHRGAHGAARHASSLATYIGMYNTYLQPSPSSLILLCIIFTILLLFLSSVFQ